MKKTIMLIDDEKDFCFFLQKNLEATGEYNVVTSNDGQEGVQRAKMQRPDLILLDIMMPGLSGSDIAAELKRDESTRNIPTVFLTGIVQEQETKDSKNIIGGWHYVSKPVKIKELTDLIKQLTP